MTAIDMDKAAVAEETAKRSQQVAQEAANKTYLAHLKAHEQSNKKAWAEARGIEMPTPAYPYPIKPAGYKMLVKMYETPKQVGAIHIPESRKADEDVASMMAEVLAMGPQAYDVNREQFSNGPWCEVGDIIIVKPYTGVRIKVDGSEYRLINDDSVDAVVVDVAKVGTFQRGY